jgi:hypothetical protein
MIRHIHYKPDATPMPKLLIDFEWWRDRSGYELEPAEISGPVVYHAPAHRRLPKLPALRGQWGLAYVPLGIRVLAGEEPLRVRRRGGELIPYRPLDVFESLFSIFAELFTADDVLHFVEKFGPLTADGLDEEKGELVDGVLAHVDALRDVFLFASGDRARRAAIIADLQANPFAELEVTLELDPGSEDPKLRFRPTSLLDALWLQAVQHISTGSSMRQCVHCSAWFEVGPGTGRRLDAKFCSDQHRVAFNSLRRTQSEASHA